MAVGFRRTLSTLTSPKTVAPSFLLDCARPKKLSYARVRSTSLPVRLHPLVAGLHDAARALLKWADAPAQTGPAWVADGADRSGKVLAGLADLLHHPQAQDALRRPKAAMARVRGLEECVAAAESGCEEVYRALVNARVSLLNLLTPTF
uniref:Uncharacterized protein n=1 Tax=Oryza punctata TaxID=4537 RepID=A0A0E0MAA5_ORYPU